MPTIKQLNQRHDSCDVEATRQLRALFLGGKHFKACINEFLPQRPAEPAAQYTMRKKEAHYDNYIGPIIDYFSSMLFSSRPVPAATKRGQDKPEPDPGEYYNTLRDNCDRTGTDIDAFFQGRFVEAMVAGRSWFRLHEPPSDGVAYEQLSRAEFESRKLGDCWLEALEYENVLDWEQDETGNLEWVITFHRTSRRKGPGGERDTIVDTWEFLTASAIETYSITYHKDNPPQDTTEVPRVATSTHRFGRVPVMCIDLPPSLWVANRLESPQLAHFRASNAQDWGMSRTCYAMPVYKVEDPEAFNARMGAGYGITITPKEDVEWTAPPGDHFAALEARIKTHKDEIFRIGHQMALGVENNSAAVGRTAESKMADAQITRVVLVAFAKAVKEAMKRAYDAISARRGDGFEWSITGLDEFAANDLLSFLEALTKTKDIGGIPSKTARVQAMIKLVDALMPELDQKTKAAIKEEIEAGTLSPEEEAEAELAKLHGIASGLTGPNADGGGTRAAGRAKQKAAPAGGSGGAASAASAA